MVDDACFPLTCDETGRPVKSFYRDAYSSDAFFRGENLPFAGWPAVGFIQQESTYWRRSLWDRTGGRLDESLELAADFELWARFHRSSAELYSVPVPLASFRVHSDQKSRNLEAYIDEAQSVLTRYGGNPRTVRGVPRLRRVARARAASTSPAHRLQRPGRPPRSTSHPRRVVRRSQRS